MLVLVLVLVLVTLLLSPIHCPLGTGPRPARPLLNTDQHQMWTLDPGTRCGAHGFLVFHLMVSRGWRPGAGGHLTSDQHIISGDRGWAGVRSNEPDRGWWRGRALVPSSLVTPPSPSLSTSTLHTASLQRGRGVLQCCSDQPPPTLITVIRAQSGAAPSYCCRLIIVIRPAVATEPIVF